MRRRFEAAPLHALLGITIEPFDESRPGTSVVTMVNGPNAFGSIVEELHGGAIATLVDVACASAASRATTYHPLENAIVTSDMHVRYLGRARGETVRCEARVVKAGSRQIVVDGEVVDGEGNRVAVCDVSFMLVPLKR